MVTRTEPTESCRDEASEPMSNAVDVLIGRLRRRVGPPRPIGTVRGVGYRPDGTDPGGTAQERAARART
ncbi:winged helix-turn-helix domain-containing protein [Streptomyces sp. NPDC087844]|uniref:winged helix-turn-helix domain-containing protein n=1 Tax=Streptomyces sp. NPDC087844 TaxID=3365805 RepID=UPI0037F3C98D